MFMSLISHVLSAWFAFLLPCFATWKSLNHLPHSEPELKRWAMYWSIVGTFVAFEYIAEWFISWRVFSSARPRRQRSSDHDCDFLFRLPFYWEVKTLFLLYLSLPQTQGSTYIYQTYLHPFLAKNEASLDAGIVAMQSNALSFIQAKLTDLFNYLARSAGAAGQQNAAGAPPGSAPNPAAWQSTAASLWNTYGASVINSLNPGAAGAAASGTPNATTPNQRSYPTTPNNARKSSASSTPSKEYFGSSTAVPNPPFPTPQHFQQQQ